MHNSRAYNALFTNSIKMNIDAEALSRNEVWSFTRQTTSIESQMPHQFALSNLTEGIKILYQFELLLRLILVILVVKY